MRVEGTGRALSAGHGSDGSASLAACQKETPNTEATGWLPEGGRLSARGGGRIEAEDDDDRDRDRDEEECATKIATMMKKIPTILVPILVSILVETMIEAAAPDRP